MVSSVSCVLPAADIYWKDCKKACVSETRPGEENHGWMLSHYKGEKQIVLDQMECYHDMEVLLPLLASFWYEI